MLDPRKRADGESVRSWLRRRVREVGDGTGVEFSFSERPLLKDPERVMFRASDEEPGTITLKQYGFDVHVGKKPLELLPATVIKLVATAVHKAQELQVERLSIEVPDFFKQQFVAMGVQLALLRADELKTEEVEYLGLTKVEFAGREESNWDRAKHGLELARMANQQRWLTGLPANILGVNEFAQLLYDHSSRGVVTWLGEQGEPNTEQYARMGMLNAVAAGNGGKRRVVAVRIDPESGPTDKVVAYVGKTLVFDVGGLNIKGKHARGMKADMSGGAALFGAFTCFMNYRDQLQRSVVLAWTITENLIGPDAYRPDDVLTAYNNKTVEVANTDAEGRLALGDAMAWICEICPDIDLVVPTCTLTGAVEVALGGAASGLHIKDSPTRLDKVGQLEALGFACGDAVNILHDLGAGVAPLESDIADLKNASDAPSGAGSQQGFHFLKQFASDGVDVWELDIAGKADTHLKGGGGMQKGTPQPAGVLFIIALETQPQ